MHKNQFSFLFFVLNARHRSWWLIGFMTDVEEKEEKKGVNETKTEFSQSIQF